MRFLITIACAMVFGISTMPVRKDLDIVNEVDINSQMDLNLFDIESADILDELVFRREIRNT
jgi:hypothetical protein